MAQGSLHSVIYYVATNRTSLTGKPLGLESSQFAGPRLPSTVVAAATSAIDSWSTSTSAGASILERKTTGQINTYSPMPPEPRAKLGMNGAELRGISTARRSAARRRFRSRLPRLFLTLLRLWTSGGARLWTSGGARLWISRGARLCTRRPSFSCKFSPLPRLLVALGLLLLDSTRLLRLLLLVVIFFGHGSKASN